MTNSRKGWWRFQYTVLGPLLTLERFQAQIGQFMTYLSCHACFVCQSCCVNQCLNKQTNKTYGGRDNMERHIKKLSTLALYLWNWQHNQVSNLDKPWDTFKQRVTSVTELLPKVSVFIQNTFESGNPEQNTATSNWLVLFLHAALLSLCTDSDV